MNEYLHKNLFGFDTNILDTSYVVFNLYVRKLRRCSAASRPPVEDTATSLRDSENGPGVHRRTEKVPDDTTGGLAATVSSLQASTASSNAEPAESMAQLVASFAGSVLEMVQQPLTSTDAPELDSGRQARSRFLRDMFCGTRLPDTARQLVEAVDGVDASCASVVRLVQHCGGLGAQPTQRAAQVELQGNARKALRRVKGARETLEYVLDAFVAECVETDGELAADESHKASAQSKTDDLYQDWMLPRCTMAELLCAVLGAMSVRAEEPTEFASRVLLQVTSTPGAEPTSLFFTSVLQRAKKQRCSFTSAALDAWRRSKQKERCPNNSSSSLATDDTLCLLSASQLRVLYHLSVELPQRTLCQMDSLLVLRSFFADLRALESDTSLSVEAFEQRAAVLADRVCDSLTVSCNVDDAELWMQHRLQSAVDQFAERRRCEGEQSVSRRSSFAQSLQNKVNSQHNASVRLDTAAVVSSSGAFSQSSSPAPPRTNSSSSVLRESVSQVHSSGSIADLLNSVSLLVDEAMHYSGHTSLAPPFQLGDDGRMMVSDCRQRLFNAIGGVNLFLRRCGLAHDTKVLASASGAKLVPTTLSADASARGDLYLPHDADEALGFSPESSELYARACLVLKELVEQQRLVDRFEALSRMPEAEFFRECHEDLLEADFAAADEHCVTSAARHAVSRRLASTMSVRVKVFHHSGEVRALTLPQTHAWNQLLLQFSDFWPALGRDCDLSYVDEDDKLVITTDREYKDLLRQRRDVVLEGLSLGGSSILGASRLGHSTTGKAPNALTLELFADLKAAAPPRPVPTRAAPGPSTGKSKPRDSQPTRKPTTGSASTVVDSMTDGMSVNEYIRRQEAKEQEQGLTMDELAKFYDRKALALGVAYSSPVAHQPSSVLPLVAEVGQPVAPTAPSAAPSPARSVFLALGREKRSQPQSEPAGATEPPSASQVVVRPTPSRWVAPPALGGQHPVSQLPGSPAARKVTSASSQPRPYGQLQLAQHQFRGEDSFLKDFRDRITQDVPPGALDDDDANPVSGPSWDRGGCNHLDAVQRQSTAEQRAMRYNGPQRRNAVPLPKTSPKK